MSYEEQKKMVTIKIIPHSIGKLINFKISKKLLKIIIGFIIFSIMCSSIGIIIYYKHSSEYQQTIANLRHLKKKNVKLKTELAKLSKDTRKLQTKFNKLEMIDAKIKKLIKYKKFNRLANESENQTLHITNQEINLNKYGTGPNLVSGNVNSSIHNTKDRLQKLKTLFPKKKEELERLKKSAIKYKDYLASKPMGWPIKTKEKRITSDFGYRTHPVLSKRMMHDGLDIGVWYGTEVYATGAGKVVYAGRKSGYGRVVVIDHGHGFKTLYGHNRRLNVKTGAKVKRGDLIAYSGNTGRSSGPHLHYEIQVNGKPVDPLDYIKQDRH
ncbi:M23 family metallopeptidase [Sporohalobacter salinus]|uniref:M23 family metallopeptidase n=1 Tax=Sporohalobacter salinus TaxID=1494606 RepID=UPI001961941E|nr:M23 family metallopeptidase [Sporohalobacter salinus]MBM7624869.1 murein DD-endopeptidase MepM/ murein hydrolase activator NlpD [Sporohalobacter salinus]